MSTRTTMPAEPMGSFKLEALSAQVGPFGRRVIEEALLAGHPSTWERRAAAFDTIMSPDPVKRAEHQEIATAFRQRAELARRYPELLLAPVAGAVGVAFDEIGMPGAGVAA